MTKQYIPQNNNVAIKPSTVEQKVGGILLPENTNSEKFKRGIFLGAGKLADLNIAPGSMILYSPFASPIEIIKGELVLIKPYDIFAVEVE